MMRNGETSPTSGAWRKIALGALACGASAFGAAAVGALLIGRLRVGKLSVRTGEFERLEVDELIIHRLRVDDDEIAPVGSL